MAYIPPDTRWYLADVVEEIHVSGRKRQTVWINTILIKATSPEEAYAKSFEVGRRANVTYKNMHGEKVSCRFRGLSDLKAVYEKLEHGCELSFRTKQQVTPKGIQSLIRRKKNLEVFADIPERGNRECSKEVLEEFEQFMAKKKRRS